MSGTVLDQGGQPLENVCVYLDGSNEASTDANGDFMIGGVPVGFHQVRYHDCRADPEYLDQWYEGHADQGSADPVEVLDQQDTALNTISMELGAGITGTITDDGASPLEDICVEAGLGTPEDHVASTRTAADGTYALAPLPPGDLFVYFHDCTGPASYIGEWYDGQPNSDTATAIPLAAGEKAPGTDAALSAGTTISGTVSDSGGSPLADIEVSVDDGVSNWDWTTTDDSGNYTSSPLPAGEYRIHFRPRSAHASEFWNDQPSWDAADTVTLDGSGPITGIDAQLAAAARIAGTVTDPGGNPIENACVSAGIGDDSDYVEGDRTDSAGNYLLDHLPAGNYRVHFDDCGESGPFLEQFWDSAGDFDGAESIELAAGETRTGIDAELARASSIAGRVTDGSGQPLEDVCVQATTSSSVGGMERTDSDGTYRIDMATGGSYRVQFADCGDDDDGGSGGGSGGGTYLAEWYGGGIEPAGATPVTVPTHGLVKGIDAALEPAGGTGRVSGRVTNVRSEGLQACIALYMPTEAVRFAPTDADGRFEFEGVPSGTWTIGFLGCGDDDVVPVVPDAGSTGVFFPATWFGGAPLAVQGSGAPDPIAQGATLVTVHPGDDLVADMCFGCEAVEVDPPEVGGDHIVVTFDSTGLSDPDSQMSGVQGTLDYNVACSSSTGKPTSATEQGPSNVAAFQVRVYGFTAGAPYVCAARILSNGVEVANARTFEVTVGETDDEQAVPATTPGAPDPAATEPADGTQLVGPYPVGSGTTPQSLAFTGGTLTFVVGLALLLIAAGAMVVVVTMRAARAQPRRRATS